MNNRHAMTKHQYYLQLRKDILEERMRCDTDNAMLLASLALQAEFNDYQPEVQILFLSDFLLSILSTLDIVKLNLILKKKSC